MQEVTGYSSAWLVTGIGEKLARKITENLKLARGSMDEREAAIPVTAPTDDVSNLKLQTVAQRLKWAREFKGWTQAHLAGLAGCTTGTIGNIESGIRLSKGSQPKIAEALGVSLKWLSDGIGERLIAPEPRRLSREAMQLANLLMCLPEEKQADAARAAIDIFISYLSPVTGESQPFAVVDNESRKS
jgi:transcriptional regulator with XRE-family HTH domain